MALVDMSPGSRPSRKARDSKKQHFRTDRLSADARFIVRSLSERYLAPALMTDAFVAAIRRVCLSDFDDSHQVAMGPPVQ